MPVNVADSPYPVSGAGVGCRVVVFCLPGVFRPMPAAGLGLWVGVVPPGGGWALAVVLVWAVVVAGLCGVGWWVAWLVGCSCLRVVLCGVGCWCVVGALGVGGLGADGSFLVGVVVVAGCWWVDAPGPGPGGQCLLLSPLCPGSLRQGGW